MSRLVSAVYGFGCSDSGFLDLPLVRFLGDVGDMRDVGDGVVLDSRAALAALMQLGFPQVGAGCHLPV